MTSTLARTAGVEITTVDDAERLARIAVASGLTALRRPEEAAVILLTGRELGLAPMQSLRGIHVVQGRPVLSADLMVAIVRRSGLCASWRTVESTPETCTIETCREGEPQPARKTWTLADAARAGLTAKGGNWKSYPSQMLRHRCAADLAREVYPDVVLGLYDPDEIDRGVSVPVAPVVVRTVPDAIAEGESCAAIATAYRAAVDGTDPSDPEIARWHSECRAAATAAVQALGLPLAPGGCTLVATTPSLAGLCDAALRCETGQLPEWWTGLPEALPDAHRKALRAACARLWQGIEPGDERDADVLRLWDAAVAPPDDRMTGVLWLTTEHEASEHAATWESARHVEASVRKHGAGLTGESLKRLVRVAVERLADLGRLTPPATVQGWASEGPKRKASA